MLASMQITGIGLSIYNGWILTLVILAFLPVLIFFWAKNVKTRHEISKEH